MKKSMILVIVLSIALVLTTLALAALNLMTQESRVAEHKIRRIRAFYASDSAKIDALERLRRSLSPVGAPGYTHISGAFPPAPGASFVYTVDGIGRGLQGYPANGISVTVRIRCRAAGGAEPSDFIVDANTAY